MDVALFLQPVQLTTYSGIAEVGDTAECGNAWKACASIISKSSKSNKDKLGNSIAHVRVDDLINKSVCHFTLTSIGVRQHDLAGSVSTWDLCRCLVCKLLHRVHPER